MAPWTCPNTQCPYDRQLRLGQQCPRCRSEAREFSFSEFGDLLKEKETHKQTINQTRKHEQLSRRRKFCPKCGSTNLNFPVFYRPSIWQCLDCGYEGAFIIEDSKLADKIQEDYRKVMSEKQ